MSYRRNKSKGNKLGLFIIIAVFILACSVFTFKVYLSNAKIEINNKTNCPINGSPEYITIIFDKSDAFNTVQQAFLKKFFRKMKSNLKTGAHVSMYIVNDKSVENISPDFVICNPDDGESANELYENKSLLNKRWHENFEVPLDGHIESFMEPSTSSISPIMEIFQIVALSTPSEAESRSKEIIIVSDMLQHTDGWSHYKNSSNMGDFKNGKFFNRVKTDLHGAQVTILLVRRDGAEKIQKKSLAYFWADYIQEMNGEVKSIEQIDG